MRTRIMNQLQALAMNEGYRWKKNYQRTRTSTVRETLVSSLGQSTSARVVGVAGPDESND